MLQCDTQLASSASASTAVYAPHSEVAVVAFHFVKSSPGLFTFIICVGRCELKCEIDSALLLRLGFDWVCARYAPPTEIASRTFQLIMSATGLLISFSCALQLLHRHLTIFCFRIAFQLLEGYASGYAPHIYIYVYMYI